MSDLPPITYRGAYIPFPNPIPAITTDPLSSEDQSLCWNADWNPAILGALKVLARPETWTGSPADIETAMQNAQDILSAIQDGCGAIAIPFSCPGDLSIDDSPYGTWSIGFCGAYVATQGFGPSLADAGGGQYYYGASIHIDLGAAYQITNIHTVFDMEKGFNGGPGSTQMYNVVDLDHSVAMGTTLTYDDLMTGFGQGFNTGPSGSPTQHFRVNLFSDFNPSGIFVPTGNMRITRVDITGIVPSGGTSPC